jgi:hypothetical protein
MHYYAKEIIQDWLISAWKFNKKHGHRNTLSIFDWKIDCGDQNHGVRLEYPILSKLRPDGTKMILGVSTIWSKSYPDLDQLADGVKVEAVLDVAIIEDGAVKYGIEVVYKHLCPRRKRDFLNGIKGLQVYEVSAEWVLSQIRKPVPPKQWPCMGI